MNRRGLRYCRGPIKRTFDIVASGTGLVLLAPVFVSLALVVRLYSGAPVFFAHTRIGRDGRPFRLFKFRTMTLGNPGGQQITGSGDSRVTSLGRWLRAFKLDELPQLLNVLMGEMSLIGPRPEVPTYVAFYTEPQRRVLLARPGLTDPATLMFRDEEDLLGRIAPEERERYYLSSILPRKLDLNLAYLDRAGFWYDLGLILRTLGTLFHPAPVSKTPPNPMK